VTEKAMLTLMNVLKDWYILLFAKEINQISHSSFSETAILVCKDQQGLDYSSFARKSMIKFWSGA
jgi:hypothetical protein